MARRRRGKPLGPDDPRRRGIKNLKPIKPGEVRNPTGKNGQEWLTQFRDFFGQIPKEKLPKGAPRREPSDTRYQIMLKALFRNVLLGSDSALKLGVEQMQGRARQHIEVTGTGSNGPVVQFLLPENGRDVKPVPGDVETPPDDGEGNAE